MAQCDSARWGVQQFIGKTPIGENPNRCFFLDWQLPLVLPYAQPALRAVSSAHPLACTPSAGLLLRKGICFAPKDPMSLKSNERALGFT